MSTTQWIIVGVCLAVPVVSTIIFVVLAHRAPRNPWED